MSEPKTLEQRITARLHESIADLVTEEDLKAMVARGIEDALFKGRHEERRSSWGSGTETYQRPSIVEENVQKLLTERMNVAVSEWLTANPERVEAVLTRIVQDGAAEAVLRSLDNRFTYALPSIFENARNQGLLPRP